MRQGPASSDTVLSRARRALQAVQRRAYNALLGEREGSSYARLPAFRLDTGAFVPLRKWAGVTAYVAGDHVKPTVANGFAYRCTIGGNSAAGEPTWPKTSLTTVVDGTVTWECHLMTPAACFVVE